MSNTEICYRDAYGRIVAWDAGMSKEESERLLLEHPDYYRSCATINKEEQYV